MTLSEAKTAIYSMLEIADQDADKVYKALKESQRKFSGMLQL